MISFINPEARPIYLSGLEEKKDSLYNLLKTYFYCDVKGYCASRGLGNDRHWVWCVSKGNELIAEDSQLKTCVEKAGIFLEAHVREGAFGGAPPSLKGLGKAKPEILQKEQLLVDFLFNQPPFKYSPNESIKVGMEFEAGTWENWGWAVCLDGNREAVDLVFEKCIHKARASLGGKNWEPPNKLARVQDFDD